MGGVERRALRRTSCRTNDASKPTTKAPTQKQTRAERDKDPKSKSIANRQAKASDP
uniref:Uncharacterized protein n=1 Tax=Peronospora matthiolae TaxID=2874970 RepID=A0AAV1TSF5_9STRA